MSGRLEPFCPAQPPRGAQHGPNPTTWPYLGLRGSSCSATGTFHRCNPHFWWFLPLRLRLGLKSRSHSIRTRMGIGLCKKTLRGHLDYTVDTHCRLLRLSRYDGQDVSCAFLVELHFFSPVPLPQFSEGAFLPPRLSHVVLSQDLCCGL